jgi:hypothetical protein
MNPKCYACNEGNKQKRGKGKGKGSNSTQEEGVDGPKAGDKRAAPVTEQADESSAHIDDETREGIALIAEKAKAKDHTIRE